MGYRYNIYRPYYRVIYSYVSGLQGDNTNLISPNAAIAY